MEKTVPNFTIEYKKSLAASGIADVTSFNDREIRLNLTEGGKAIITGEAMKIVCFEKRTGEFRLAGVVSGVKFSSASQSFIKRFFR